MSDLAPDVFRQSILSPVYQQTAYSPSIHHDPFDGISYAEFMAAIRIAANRPAKVKTVDMWFWTIVNGHEIPKRIKVRVLQFPGWLR